MMKKNLILFLLTFALIFSSACFAKDNQNSTYITVTPCACDSEQMLENFNLMAAAEQKVLFSYIENWEYLCAAEKENHAIKKPEKVDEEK